MSKGAVQRANPDRVISHWYRLVSDLKSSSQAFYVRLQQVLRERHVPGLESA
jgi:hypothetical protein